MGWWPSVSGLSWLAVETMESLPPPFLMSHTHPEPKRLRPASLKALVKSSKVPKLELMASAMAPVGLPPPFGFMLAQNHVWLRCPPALLRTAALAASGTEARFLTMSSMDFACHSGNGGSAGFKLLM